MGIMKWLGGCLMSALTLTGCTPLEILNSTVSHNGYSRIQDIAYGEHSRQKLDIYQPENMKGEVPVVVFFYGGRWQEGKRDDYRFAAQALASKGWIVVVPDYRLFPEVRFPGFIEDSAAAVRWTRRNIAQYGGVSDRLFLMGHSAGAYNAAMLALDSQWLGADHRAIAGLIGLSGPYDFLPFTDEDIKLIFAPAGDLRLSQPITFASEDDPPALLVTGLEDSVVGLHNSRNLRDKLRGLGVDVEYREYAGRGHAGVVVAMASWFRGLAPVLDDTERFIEQQMKLPTRSAAATTP